MVNMNMMGQMPGVQDTSEMAMQQAMAAQQQAQFTPQTLQAGQAIYGTPEQKLAAITNSGTSAAVI